MPLNIYRRGEIWHYRGTAAGRRLRGSCGTSDKETARRIAAETEAAAWRRHLDGPEAHVTFAQAALAYRQAEKADRFLAKIEDHWRDTPLREIRPERVKEAARRLYPTSTGATRNRQVIVPTQAIINHAAALGWCSPIRVPRFSVNAKRKVPATRDWVTAFADQARADGLPHHAALALFMFATGARVGEATALRWRDVDLAGATATIRIFKPRPWTRTAHLPPAVVAAMAGIGGNRNPDEQVFRLADRGSVYKTWKNIIARAKLSPLTPHCARHGFATSMLRLGRDVATIAARGGWKDPTTVLRTYAHAVEDQTVTDALFDTPATQGAKGNQLETSNQRRKQT